MVRADFQQITVRELQKILNKNIFNLLPAPLKSREKTNLSIIWELSNNINLSGWALITWAREYRNWKGREVGIKLILKMPQLNLCYLKKKKKKRQKQEGNTGIKSGRKMNGIAVVTDSLSLRIRRKSLGSGILTQINGWTETWHKTVHVYTHHSKKRSRTFIKWSQGSRSKY